MGRATSLMVVCVIGMVAAVGVVVLAVLGQSIWFGVMAFFAIFRCWQASSRRGCLLHSKRHRVTETPSARRAASIRWWGTIGHAINVIAVSTRSGTSRRARSAARCSLPPYALNATAPARSNNGLTRRPRIAGSQSVTKSQSDRRPHE